LTNEIFSQIQKNQKSNAASTLCFGHFFGAVFCRCFSFASHSIFFKKQQHKIFVLSKKQRIARRFGDAFENEALRLDELLEHGTH
jgi:hypothetical protein